MDNEKLSALLQDYCFKLPPGQTLTRFLEDSRDPSIPVEKLVAIVENNALFAHYVQKVDLIQHKVAGWAAEEPEHERGLGLPKRIIGLLGRSASRNALATIRMNRMVGPGLPRKEGEKYLVLPRQALPFAFAAVEFCEKHELANPELAYIAGMHFDWVAALLNHKGGAVKAEKTYLDEIWRESLQNALVAYDLASLPKNLKLSHYAFSAALLTGLGKVFMSVLFPKGDAQGSWKDFIKEMAKYKDQHQVATLLLEREKFAITHAEISSMIVGFFELLKPIDKAVNFYREPYYLKKLKPDEFGLAVILSAANTLGGLRLPLEKGKKLPLSAKQLQWLKPYNIQEKDVLATLARRQDKGKDKEKK